MTGEPVHIDRSGQAIRLQRADARKNRDKILAAARAAFDSGGETSMAEVARRAGVGMATLYRNFPGRRELLQAVYADKVAAVCAAADAAGGRDDPGPALREWLVGFAAFARSKHGLAAEILAEGDGAALGAGRAAIVAAGGPLLDAAQAGGAVRADLTFDQVLSLVVAVGGIRGPDEYVRGILEVVLDGLVV
jgi:AcrR family transcriptional regulator